MYVSNTGEGNALDTWVNLRNLSGEAVFLHSGREQLKKLAPGETRTVDLDIEIKRRPQDGNAKLQLRVSDGKVHESVSEKIVIPIREESLPIDSASGILAASGAVDLYASPLTAKMVVAKADAGAKFKVTGEAGDWYRVDTTDGGSAFVKKSDVSKSSGKATPDAIHPALVVSPPQVNLMGTVTQTHAESISISGKITDDQAVRDVYVTVVNPSRDLFGDQEKVFYQAATDPSAGDLEFAADVPLTPGNNLIQVYARENDEVVAVRRMWVLRTSGLAQARAADRKAEGKGRLRVDTFQ